MRTVDKIQEVLDSKNIKASKMMKDLGFSSGLFSQWKSGKQEVSLEKIIKIADYLECSIDYLLGRGEHPDGIFGNINGDNNIQANGLSANGNVNLSAGNQKLDELSEELIKNFNVLTTTQKARIIVMIDEMRKGA